MQTVYKRMLICKSNISILVYKQVLIFPLWDYTVLYAYTVGRVQTPQRASAQLYRHLLKCAQTRLNAFCCVFTPRCYAAIHKQANVQHSAFKRVCTLVTSRRTATQG